MKNEKVSSGAKENKAKSAVSAAPKAEPVSTAMAAKLKMLNQFKQTMNKKHGDDTLILGQADGASIAIERQNTGCPELDLITGGGLPKGRIVEIYGPEASGKSTICWSTMAQIQAQGGLVGYVDTEQALDREYLKKMGIDLDKVVISQPENAEKALTIYEEMVESGIFTMVVLDSVAVLATQKELEGELGDAQMGGVARLMGQHLRRVTASVKKTNTIAVYINQIRMKIGGYGNPETTTGGNALKFYASIRLDVRRIEAVKGEGDRVIGQKNSIKTAKNKTAMPFQRTEVTLLYGIGFDQITGVYDEAVAKGIITKGGGSHYMGNDKTNKLAPSRSAMIERLRTEPDLLEEIKQMNSVTEMPEPSEEK